MRLDFKFFLVALLSCSCTHLVHHPKGNHIHHDQNSSSQWGNAKQHHPSLKSTGSSEKNNDITEVLKSLVSGKKTVPKELTAPGNRIARPVVKKQVYFKDVAPVIKKKCTSCHNPQGTGLMNFISYEDIAGRGAMFKYVIEKNLMPPWYIAPHTGPFQDDIGLTLKEKALLLKWANLGFPKKKRGKILLWSKPKRIKPYKDKPDYVFSLPEKVSVPAEGASFYKYFVIQTPFTEDRWIKNIQFVLKPKVIHHFIVWIMKPSYKDDDPNFFNQAVQYFMNVPPGPYSFGKYDIEYKNKNVGMRLPRKAKLVLDIHYEPIGQKVIDDYSKVHINFHKKTPKYEILTTAYEHKNIKIPPHTSNYKTEISFKTEKKGILHSVHTHMHVRGKASSILMTEPKGVKKRIFGLDPFTKTFERTYAFKKPLLVPKGSLIKCVNWFDNSAKNPTNPAPQKYVTYGLFTEHEMSICFFEWLVPVNENPSLIFWNIISEFEK